MYFILFPRCNNKCSINGWFHFFFFLNRLFFFLSFLSKIKLNVAMWYVRFSARIADVYISRSSKSKLVPFPSKLYIDRKFPSSQSSVVSFLLPWSDIYFIKLYEEKKEGKERKEKKKEINKINGRLSRFRGRTFLQRSICTLPYELYPRIQLCKVTCTITKHVHRKW